MAFNNKPMVMLVLFFASLQVSMATVYKVGGDKGWTTMNPPNYTEWATSKTFHVGDVIEFDYLPQFHNVMEVKHADYQTCNVAAPIRTLTTGKDSIPITKTGHFYYFCGIPGHCISGQKVDIRVLSGTSPTTPSPASSPSPSQSPSAAGPKTEAAPTPSSNNSASLPTKSFLALAALGLAAFAGFTF